MPWPPTPSSNFIVNGSSSATTLVWGTDGLTSGDTGGTNNPLGGSAIIKSMRRANMAEEIKIENGTGLTAWFVQLVDGVEIEFTCVYDTDSVTASQLEIGDIVTINDPFTADSGSVKFIITQNPMNLARKQEAEFNITAKYFTTAAVPSQSE